MDFSPKMPLKYSRDTGNFEMNTEPLDAITQNLKMIVLCSKGEKVCDYNFGAGCYDVLFEQKSSSLIQDKVSEIYSQVERYLPVVQINDVQMNAESGALPGWVLRIHFSVPELGYNGLLEI